MLKNIDEDEKGLYNVYTLGGIQKTMKIKILKSIDDDEKLHVILLHAGQNREVIMLTEELADTRTKLGECK